MLDDLVEQLVRVVEYFPRGRLLEYRRVLALQLPRVEEELPVDVWAQRRQVGLDTARTGEGRPGELVEEDLLAVSPRRFERRERATLLVGVLLA